MLGRSLMNAGRRAARTVGRRNMSSADPYAAPEVLKAEMDAAEKASYFVVVPIALTSAWAYYLYAKHEAHENHEPYIKPNFPHLRQSITELPWSREYPGCTFFDPVCEKYKGVDNIPTDNVKTARVRLHH